MGHTRHRRSYADHCEDDISDSPKSTSNVFSTRCCSWAEVVQISKNHADWCHEPWPAMIVQPLPSRIWNIASFFSGKLRRASKRDEHEAKAYSMRTLAAVLARVARECR